MTSVANEEALTVTDDHRIRGWEMLHHPFADEERFINLGLAGNRGS